MGVTYNKTRSRIVFLFSILLFSLCSVVGGPGGSGPWKRNAFQNSVSAFGEALPLVFVPGYKGSELIRRDTDGSTSRIWLTPWQALNLTVPDLTLRENDGVEVGDVLSSVTLIPYLIEAQIYRPWLDFVSSRRIKTYVFPYDWRKDNGENSLKLETFLERVRSENQGVLPVLVGHSNGGNLVLSVLNRKPDLASKVVFAGVPFRGGIGFMRDLVEGVSTGLNPEIAGPCVVASFIGVYTFFSRGEGFDVEDGLKDGQGRKITFRFFNASDWENFELGPYSHEAHCEPAPSPKEFQKRLDLAKKFRDSLSPVLGKRYPKILVVHARNRRTIRNLRAGNDPDHWFWDFKNSEYSPGDGRVTFESSIPPEGIEYESFISEEEHSSLLNDPSVWKKIEVFLFDSNSS
ncbi:lecithin--cholesterol acyltransferase [Leptospira gomenensis]|uniref:Lecithin--cholesterol acyltransferase n=1 Tax=Leptospira gomenensis TaxID=2484974 RepID=A0A5F1YTY9_9LEPT|nr:lecithin--cholesterol acyltransferase [Leptospira gomenensis]TGK33798.1 lecithin--cholesterol acyltransferase [Leptospira gomenensis]TGK36367.1 lecithin--cholesterol acyltransferase [Leptospira gomenensis]TGK47391.1 lecithin--cholesterol acyltransferase [Leptospira gomenensis]TGK60660.1 lecithin--cholesterol acyltransferase [Leptospira gomenensis]